MVDETKKQALEEPTMVAPEKETPIQSDDDIFAAVVEQFEQTGSVVADMSIPDKKCFNDTPEAGLTEEQKEEPKGEEEKEEYQLKNQLDHLQTLLQMAETQASADDTTAALSNMVNSAFQDPSNPTVSLLNATTSANILDVFGLADSPKRKRKPPSRRRKQQQVVSSGEEKKEAEEVEVAKEEEVTQEEEIAQEEEVANEEQKKKEESATKIIPEPKNEEETDVMEKNPTTDHKKQEPVELETLEAVTVVSSNRMPAFEERDVLTSASEGFLEQATALMSELKDEVIHLRTENKRIKANHAKLTKVHEESVASFDALYAHSQALQQKWDQSRLVLAESHMVLSESRDEMSTQQAACHSQERARMCYENALLRVVELVQMQHDHELEAGMNYNARLVEQVLEVAAQAHAGVMNPMEETVAASKSTITANDTQNTNMAAPSLTTSTEESMSNASQTSSNSVSACKKSAAAGEAKNVSMLSSFLKACAWSA